MFSSEAPAQAPEELRTKREGTIVEPLFMFQRIGSQLIEKAVANVKLRNGADSWLKSVREGLELASLAAPTTKEQFFSDLLFIEKNELFLTNMTKTMSCSRECR